MQDNSGNADDGVVDATEVLESITDALAAVGAGTYEAIDIAPVDGADGGIPGGNIRVALLWRPDRVELAASLSGEKGSATAAIKVVDEGGSARFSENPGVARCMSAIWAKVVRSPQCNICTRKLERASENDANIVDVH